MLKHHLFEYKENFKLESGEHLPGFNLSYTTYGTLNQRRDNIIWVCHALTANSDFTEWWPGLFGKGKLYDPDKYFVVCANMLGGCYGSTGPLSINPKTGLPFFHDFPDLTNRDIVDAFELLRQGLGIEKVHTIIGGSLGGQHVLEWVIQKPGIFNNMVVIASNAKHSPWGIAFNESQRQAIAMDLTWKLNTEKAGMNGMKVARSIALLSYRHYATYLATQEEEDDDVKDNFKASSYQVYQGDKLAKRFNAFSYWTLSKAMDSHNLGRGRGGIVKALQGIKVRSLFISIATDQLFPVNEQKFLADRVNDSTFEIIDSSYGHDGFLIEAKQLTGAVANFYQQNKLNPEIA